MIKYEGKTNWRDALEWVYVLSKHEMWRGHVSKYNIFYSYNTPVKKSQLKFFPTKTYKDKMIIIIIFLEPISWVNLGQSLGHSSSLRSWVGLTIINLS